MTQYKAKNFIVNAEKCNLYQYNEKHLNPGVQHAENKRVNGFEVCWCGYSFFLPEDKFYELYEELDNDLSCDQ